PRHETATPALVFCGTAQQQSAGGFSKNMRCCRWIESCLAAAAAVLPAVAYAKQHEDQNLRHEQSQQQRQRLGVVVPIYDGDLARAVRSLERWPT
ncbi:unnamed protein product, partial [Ectocarpus sp. 12 AP-2014]